MKKPLLFLIFVGFLAWLYFRLTAFDHNPLYVSPKQKILPIMPENKKALDEEVYKVVNSINSRNEKIKSFLVENMSIKYGRLRLSGQLMMEKPQNFRMKIDTILGKEMDVGSNENIFWFWSKRMEPPVLHYSSHQNIGKSNLKTPLNPSWLMSSLNIGEVEKGYSIRHKNFLGIMSEKKSPNGEQVSVLTLISSEGPAIAGHYLYDKSGRMIASSEVKSYNKIGEHILPKQMLIIWYQEGVSMEWDLQGQKINVGIDPTNWIMPTMRNSIDIGR